MKKTTDHLSDGREIIYFDADDDGRDHHPDLRDLPPVSTTSQLRHDPLLNEWVVLASHRQDRTHLPQAAQCPLCPSRGDRRTEVPAPDYRVVVFENRFPSLSAAAEQPNDGTALVPRAPGRGRCEVVCFSSDHDGSFATLSPEQARLVVDAWADRTAALSEHPAVEQVFCFENRGEEIGVTLSHPHGQIYAYPFVTPRTATMLDSARRHHDRTGRNLFADVLAEERAAGERVVASSAHWTAFVPAFARWPVEVHLYPHRQVTSIPELDDHERDDFARLYLDVLRRFDRLYDRPLPYVAAWHQAPVSTGHDLAYLHLQLSSTKRAPAKLKYLAGSESGMGAFVTDVLPEDVAARLRAAGTEPTEEES
ncbi:UDPglucose--hexose-1-phosphate uridylyltransferase [Haloactinopolyspora alba]|uniref:Galactose-1-phosphate uridylyltransferase n=1 Tax=Haloactinopolyspora alba TaxID=648780 RepID=A0A2P8E5D6_9ACTN|nr:galactose-1-phosphate uridylyltransferase [Haloactinopolyspora alba]PSL04688.1 UDPglucose--hexose-1-phosphate uridylyltransferase [Haloactinopolyspora alba]